MSANGSTPSIAVVIPNRNDSIYLPACLTSVLSQSVLPDEIIFVDDGSSDDSLEQARRLLGQLPGALLLSNPESLGTMSALNAGLARANSDYVLFLASNDFLADGIIDRAKASISKLGWPGVWSAMVWSADERGRCKYVYPSPVIARTDTYFSPDQCIRLAFRLGNWFTGTTMFYHRATLQAIGGFDVEYRGLADLFAALTIASLKGAVFCPLPFGVMRLHADGYLWRTLTDHAQLERLIERLAARGPRLSAALFTESFLATTRNRIRFAALRAMQPNVWPQREPAWQTGALRFIRRLRGPLASRPLRTVIAFLLLRPGDIGPALWYRVIARGGLMFGPKRLRPDRPMSRKVEFAEEERNFRRAKPKA